jgi:amino acid transporter
MGSLQNSTDVLTTWSSRISPAFLPWLRLAVIASTAGSLWLTTFILSRALFSMSRDGVMPLWIGRLTLRKVPRWAIIVPIAIAMAVILLETFLPSMEALFALVLSAAGFFLVAEFFLDSVNMLAFLIRHHRTVRHALTPHHHALLFIGAIFVALMLGALEILFFIEGPRYIGAGIDWVTGAMLLAGGAYVIWLHFSGHAQHTVSVFADKASADVSTVGEALLRD